MRRELRIGYVLHSLRSDWNNGNAHFLRGLLRAMAQMGHTVTAFEEPGGWSETNLLTEPRGHKAIEQFGAVYPELRTVDTPREVIGFEHAFASMDAVIVHEWNSPEVIAEVLAARDRLGFKALFHDTHHRASSSPEQIARLQVARFDGVIVFGESLRTIYRERFGVERAWTLHEAADTTVFYPRAGKRRTDVVWVGNWGEDERAKEIGTYLLRPAARLRSRRFAIYGVRYPDQALGELHEAGVEYRGYLPNLEAPQVYAESGLTVHIPRQQYAAAMVGIPTIRVFEALASGTPLISAPWEDVEGLFAAGDYRSVTSEGEMERAMCELLEDSAMAQAQAERGLRTVLARHTCGHRARELTAILEEVLG